MDIADLVTRLNGLRYSEYGLCARGIFVACFALHHEFTSPLQPSKKKHVLCDLKCNVRIRKRGRPDWMIPFLRYSVSWVMLPVDVFQ